MPYSLRVKVYYEDTDAGGVVYYANYLRFMERSRTEFLAEKGIDIAALHNSGLFFVVAHIDISYKRPARLGDLLEITSDIVELKNASIVIRNRVIRDGTIMVDALLTLACIDKDGRPTRLPETFSALKA